MTGFRSAQSLLTVSRQILNAPMLDKTFMLEALQLSKQALPDCRPNPPVGCVLVRNQLIISRGYTQKPGAIHAEALALEKLSKPMSDVTAYVTMEPCSFVGRTPACAQSLIDSSV
ncbi:MAG: putative riboflavin deaminase [Osedax symbiont Rs2]|nr:MAG: putative riboflavin deaminase [Osedax symbiont Rs2]